MSGSSILKGTGHTDQVKPRNLSVRSILSDGEPCSDNFSDSEQSEGISDSEDEWESCVSSIEEDKCFYDVVSLEKSQDTSYYSFPTRSLSSNFETNLSGLAMDSRQPSKCDQVPDLNEKAYLTQRGQVPELNETYLVEGMGQLNNYGSHLGILSNMMEKEAHVDSVSFDEQKDIC